MKKITFLANLIQAKIFCLLIFAMLTGCKSIDVRGQFVSDDAIKEINESGTTILIATHDYDIISKFPEKTIRVEKERFFELSKKS